MELFAEWKFMGNSTPPHEYKHKTHKQLVHNIDFSRHIYSLPPTSTDSIQVE